MAIGSYNQLTKKWEDIATGDNIKDVTSGKPVPGPFDEQPGHPMNTTAAPKASGNADDNPHDPFGRNWDKYSGKPKASDKAKTSDKPTGNPIEGRTWEKNREGDITKIADIETQYTTIPAGKVRVVYKTMPGLGIYDPVTQTWKPDVQVDMVASLKATAEAGMTSNETNMAFSESILQTLNRQIGESYYPADVFEANVAKFEGCPVVFADNHPSLDLFSTNPKEALAKVNGRIIGTVTNARVVKEGHPRLMANVEVNDPIAMNIWRNGELSLSTAFKGNLSSDKSKLTGIASVNHLLVFREDEAAGSMPRDRGALLSATKDDIKEA
jgi:hypothetical protein